MANSSVLADATVNGVSVFILSSNVRLERQAIAVTALGDSWENNVHGVAKLSGSVEVAYDKSDHASMLSPMTSGANTPVTITLTWNTGETWTGPALITGFDVTATVDDIVKATVSFQSTHSGATVNWTT
jgi:hypothetical protein